jgi:hypothetical protein
MTTATMRRPATRIPVPVADALAALAIAIAFVGYHAVLGFPTLADSGGDNDSVMRLVRVRDLIAGQGWFDPMQYRMGLDGGFAMHWSRLIDLPLAALIVLLGETAALVIWPAGLFAAAMFFFLRAARNIGETAVFLPAAVIGGLALYYVNVFTPGALDHHNVQLVLALAMLVMLLRHERPLACGALAGGFAALMLAVGMEAAPVVAVACASVALALLFGKQDGSTSRARGFGIAFGAVAMLCLAATVPPGAWLVAQCDAFSLPHASLAVLGGFGLAGVATVPALTTRPRRILALGALGAAIATTLLIAFPQCLADPYAGLDPRLVRYWLGAVSEAQPALSVLRADPAMFAAYYVTPVIALCVMPLLWRRGESREMATMAALLATAFLLSVWQVRGSLFSLPLAAIPLAAWVAQARSRVAAAPTARAQFLMVAAWLVSFNIVWQVGVRAIVGSETRVDNVETAAVRGPCTAALDHQALARLPKGTVLAISNLGSPILAHTPHHVLAGPYHRNVDGNLAALDLMMGDPIAVADDARRLGIDYVAVCPGNAETSAIRGWAPGGLLAALASGTVPPWLTLAGQNSEAMLVYRVRNSAK